MDRELDQAAAGPKWLANPAVADAVAEALLAGQALWKLYDLHAWVLMPNHVHILITPHKPLAEITRIIKSASGREANALLDRRGHMFWQAESYDHWVRSEREFWKIVDYIEAQTPVDWRWSSAAIAQ